MVINWLFDNLLLCIINNYYSKILVTLKAPKFIDIDNLSGHHEGEKKINNWPTLVHTNDDDELV